MIERTTDPTFPNVVLNHEAVRPWVTEGEENKPIDITPAVSNPQNVCLRGEHGVFIVIKFGTGIWECHTAVLPEGRGMWARNFAEAGARYMFTATDCAEILTRVPRGHVAAKALTEAMGFRPQFVSPPETKFRGELVPIAIYTLTIQEWAVRAALVEDEGAAFHAWLNKQVEQGQPHEPDPWHNRVVGITLAMMQSGQLIKGAVWYNRWALSVRHPIITLINQQPPQILFDAGILTLEGTQISYSPKPVVH